jgi:uncharacterized protein (DUF302 family)
MVTKGTRMKRIAIVLLAFVSLQTQAQTAAPTPEQAAQMQQLMAYQMKLMATMYDLRLSHFGFEETITAIRTGAEKRGWKVGETHDMQADMRKAGAKDARRMKVVSLCPEGAAERVAKAGAGKAPPLPCRVTVFESGDGKINVVHLNLHTLSKGLKGDLSKVLGELAVEEDALYKPILE